MVRAAGIRGHPVSVRSARRRRVAHLVSTAATTEPLLLERAFGSATSPPYMRFGSLRTTLGQMAGIEGVLDVITERGPKVMALACATA